MNTQRINFKGVEFEVQKELNNEAYSAFESDSKFLQRTSDDRIINLFVENRDRFLSLDLINFLEQAGVDHKKENEIYHYKIENQTIIAGWYDIIGKIMSNKTATLFWDNEDSTTNITFTNDETHGIRPELKSNRTFRLHFELVLY